ncbi:competence protein [Paraliobacillus quinghaiensis]|uniref:Competence protein n=1 Tax=Paraliobacillus quinghaiensis TaxID=470815 RepID=A0A917TJF0_9BACI|nr:competence protein CoiA family protein [Paraliobacillus quinghaiensis]GGM24846.1 competence protein [Paraliobacillus quinghaiensis]
MLQAVCDDGQLLTLALLEHSKIDEYKRNNKFFCPICREQVIIKAGMKMVAHFAHQKQSNCSIATNGEGQYHERGKLDLYHWLKRQGISTQIEKYLPMIAQRPDILVTIGKKQIAIEYQCANLSLPELIKRTNGYRTENITPIWILGGNRMKRKSNNSLALTSNDLHYIHQFNQAFPNTLYYYCPNTKQIARFQDILLTGRKKAIGSLEFYSISDCSLPGLFQPIVLNSNQIRYQLWLKEKLRFRTEPPIHLSRTERQWREWLYLKRLSPSTLTAVIHLPTKSQWQMKVPPWNWQSRLCIDFLNKKTTFTLRECQAFLRKYWQTPSIFPLIYPTSNPISEYLDCLIQLGFIKRINSHYHVQKKMEGYATLDSAIKQDETLMLKLERLSSITHEN